MSKHTSPTDIDTTAVSGKGRGWRSATATGLLLSIWALLVVGSFMLDDTMSPRFLDLPLGAFLAGQGALMGLVLVGIRIARPDMQDRD